MLITHQLRQGGRVLTALPPGPPPARRARAARGGADARRAVHHGHVGGALGRWTTSGQGTRGGHRAPFFLDTVPVTNAAYIEFIAAGRLDNRAGGAGAGLGHRRQEAWSAPAVLALGEGQWVEDPVGVTEPVLQAEQVAARVLVRGRRLRALGRAADCPPRRSGRRRPGSNRPPGGPAGSRGVTRGAQAGPADLGQRHLQPAPAAGARTEPRRVARRQLIGDGWEMDVESVFCHMPVSLRGHTGR